jgi:hypothetical protein
MGQYFEDLARVLCEIQRVLKPGRAAIVLAGPLVVGGMALQVHEIIGEMAEAVGLQWVGTQAIGAHPDRANSNGNGIKAGKHQDCVIGLVK